MKIILKVVSPQKIQKFGPIPTNFINVSNVVVTIKLKVQAVATTHGEVIVLTSYVKISPRITQVTGPIPMENAIAKIDRDANGSHPKDSILYGSVSFK